MEERRNMNRTEEFDDEYFETIQPTNQSYEKECRF